MLSRLGSVRPSRPVRLAPCHKAQGFSLMAYLHPAGRHIPWQNNVSQRVLYTALNVHETLPLLLRHWLRAVK